MFHDFENVVARLDLEERQISSLVRSSVHYYNTDEELDRFAGELTQLLGKHV